VGTEPYHASQAHSPLNKCQIAKEKSQTTHPIFNQSEKGKEVTFKCYHFLILFNAAL